MLAEERTEEARGRSRRVLGVRVEEVHQRTHPKGIRQQDELLSVWRAGMSDRCQILDGREQFSRREPELADAVVRVAHDGRQDCLEPVSGVAARVSSTVSVTLVESS